MEPKKYKTVASLLKAYEKGALSKRKDKIKFKDFDGESVEVQTGDGQDVVFEMDTVDFIKQIAKLGGVKLPTAF